MNPPASVAGNRYSIQLELRDNNQEEPGESKYEFAVEILKDASFNPVFNFTNESKQEKKAEVNLESSNLEITVQAPNNVG